MDRVGIIDIGSNSVRLVIIDVKENRAHHQIEHIEESVRLRSGTDSQGSLSEEGITYATETVALFVNFCKARRVKHIISVATAAVRRAPNGQKLVQQILQETGIKTLILSAEEEAHLGYLGVINSVTEQAGLMADLGGGSLKIVSFDHRLNQNAIALDFGAVSLMDQFDLSDLPTEENLANLENFLDKNFDQIPWLKGQSNLIGIGGTFRSLARVYRNHVHYLPDITDGIVIPTEVVGEIYHKLSKLDGDQRRKVLGLERSRADLSVAGFGIIYKLLLATGSPNLTVSAASIRDGLFFRHLYPRDPILFNVLTHHTNNLLDYHDLDENHLRRISNLSVTLFDQLQPLHGLGSTERRLLLIAGLLHELGVVISVESLEKHTLYTILNSPLRGLNHRERVLVSYLAASHEQLFQVNLIDHVTQGPISLSDVQSLKKLAPLLQIAHSLDRSRSGGVTHLQTRLTPEVCEIQVFGTGKIDLEIRDARRRAEVFQKEYGPKLVINKG